MIDNQQLCTVGLYCLTNTTRAFPFMNFKVVSCD